MKDRIWTHNVIRKHLIAVTLVALLSALPGCIAPQQPPVSYVLSGRLLGSPQDPFIDWAQVDSASLQEISAVLEAARAASNGQRVESVSEERWNELKATMQEEWDRQTGDAPRDNPWNFPVAFEGDYFMVAFMMGG